MIKEKYKEEGEEGPYYTLKVLDSIGYESVFVFDPTHKQIRHFWANGLNGIGVGFFGGSFTIRTTYFTPCLRTWSMF